MAARRRAAAKEIVMGVAIGHDLPKRDASPAALRRQHAAPRTAPAARRRMDAERRADEPRSVPVRRHLHQFEMRDASRAAHRAHSRSPQSRGDRAKRASPSVPQKGRGDRAKRASPSVHERQAGRATRASPSAPQLQAGRATRASPSAPQLQADCAMCASPSAPAHHEEHARQLTESLPKVRSHARRTYQRAPAPDALDLIEQLQCP